VKYKLDSSSSDEQGDPDSSDTAQQNTKMGRRTDSAQHTSDSDAPENSGKERTKRSRAETTKDDSADDDHEEGDEDDSEEQEEIGNVESQNTNRKRDASDGEGASAESVVVNEGTESEQKTKRRRIQALSDEDSE
jgi:hypothetical protein